MTAREFQINHHGDLKLFLDTPVGKELLSALSSLRPPYSDSPHEHLFIDNRGTVKGYELCLRNMVALCLPPSPTTEVKANYGVDDRKPEDKK